MKFKHSLDKKLDEWILIFGFSVILLLMFSQVVFQFLFHIPLIGLFEELSRFIFVWLAWFAVSYSIRTNSHIRIEMFVDFFFKKDKAKVFVKYIENALFLLFAVFLVIAGIQLAQTQIASGFTSPMLRVPLWIVFLGIPISGLLMIIRLIQEFYHLIKKSKQESAIEE